jgi:anaerobic dimethyl sulfoxide reductase subunit B (iron-sulfur subunit)
MEQYGFLFETDKCVACKACEIACQKRHQSDQGLRLRTVTSLVKGEFPNVTVTNLSMSCMHCGKPLCAAVCPVGAITRRLEDGIIIVDEAKCIGCHACLSACPFNVPQFRDSGTMVKCDLCLDRKELGLEPACVRACFYDALHAGPLSELHAQACERLSERIARSSQPSVSTAK